MQTQATKRTIHMGVALTYFERMADETLLEWFSSTDDQPITAQDAREYIADLRAQGFELLPCKCGNYDEKGQCKGAA